MFIEDIFKLYVNGLSLFNLKHRNESKILVFFRYWLIYFEYLIQNDTEINNKTLSNNLTLYQIKYNNALHRENLRNKILKNILKHLSLIKFFNVGILPGGRSDKKLSRLSNLFLSAELLNTKYEINTDFKEYFFLKAKNILNEKEYDFLLMLIPQILFSKLNNYYFDTLPTIFRGSPACLMTDNYLYLPILFHNKEVKIIGIQHGGGYSEWRNRTSENMEKSISDIFYSWSFGEPLITQNRFKINYKSKRKHITWIGREIVSWKNTHNFIDDAEEHFKNFKHLKYFINKLNFFKIVFLPHPNNKNYEYNNLFINFNNINLDKDEIIQNSKIVIFDCLSHTLLFRCLLSNIPFIILLDELPFLDLTNNSLVFYKLLKENNLLFVKNEVQLDDSKFDSFILGLNNSNNNFFNEILLNKLKSFFINDDITEVTATYSSYIY